MNWSVLRADLIRFCSAELVGGKLWPRLLWSGARLWNKKVNLLLVWFVGYECFLPLLFYGSQSVAFKGTEMFLPKRRIFFHISLAVVFTSSEVYSLALLTVESYLFIFFFK